MVLLPELSMESSSSSSCGIVEELEAIVEVESEGVSSGYGGSGGGEPLTGAENIGCDLTIDGGDCEDNDGDSSSKGADCSLHCRRLFRG